MHPEGFHLPLSAPVEKTDDEASDRTVIIRDAENGVFYKMYRSEAEMARIMELITKDLSEPYSIYTYRYFIHNWPHLCILVSWDLGVNDSSDDAFSYRRFAKSLE